MARPTPLPAGELGERLGRLPGWQIADGKLHRTFEFPDFVQAFQFMAGVALAAERLGHHPDWSNSYNRVTIDLVTHDAGGITALDFELAARAQALAPR
jgi:4a-hydroxytetrahydrobiopterin dehydratase